MRPAALVLLLLVGCTSGRDVWDLRHARVLAVRASAPQLRPGEDATIIALVADDAGDVQEAAPTTLALAPDTTPALAGVAIDGATITAPSAGDLAAARAELGLGADASVPLVVIGDWPGTDGVPLRAAKTVELVAADVDPLPNPAIDELTLDGAAVDTAATVLLEPELTLAIDADDATSAIDWRTSLGTLEDFEDRTAHLELDEPGVGAVVVIRRDPGGGTAWRVLHLTVDPTPETTDGSRAAPVGSAARAAAHIFEP